MPLTLTGGGESRLDGAPDQLLPPFADGVEALAQAILADDTDNVYGGDINLARQIARQQLSEKSERSRAGQAAAAQAGADRNRTRAARRGVSPESLPMDEYGAVSGRTVQEANRPLPEAEAALGMEQEAADAIIRGLREGTPVFGPQGDLDFLRERGERNPLEPNGRTDMAMRARIRERRGQFAEMPDGTRIPIGAEPTDAQIRSEREGLEWANETPGTERQALYDPAGYEEFREGVRQDIQDRARKDKATYGTGVTDPDTRADLGLGPLTPEQAEARARRQRSEARVRYAQQGRFYGEKLQAETGMPAGTPEEVMEAERFKQRQASRMAEQKARRGRVADNARLRAQGIPLAVGALPEADRADAIRGLLPNRNAAGDVADRDFQLKLQGLEAAQAQSKMEFDAKMAAIAAENARANAAMADARAKWEAEQKAAQDERDKAAADRAAALGNQQREVDVKEQEVKSRDATARALPGIQAEAEANAAGRREAAEAARIERERTQDMEMQRLQADIASYGGGVQHIMEGRLDTPAAHQSLTRIATAADQSRGGFYEVDAVRMDAELFRLGVKDPQVRHALVYRYGLGTAPGSTWQASDVDGRDNILSGLGMAIFGGPSFPTR